MSISSQWFAYVAQKYERETVVKGKRRGAAHGSLLGYHACAAYEPLFKAWGSTASKLADIYQTHDLVYLIMLLVSSKRMLSAAHYHVIDPHFSRPL